MDIIKKRLRSVVIVLTAIAVMLIIVMASYFNYKSIQDNVIEIEQLQLLSLSETLAKSIENFFTDQLRNVEILAKNRYFLRDFTSYSQDFKNENEFQNLEDYYSIQSDNIELIRLVDLTGNEIFTYPNTDLGVGINDDLISISKSNKRDVGEIYKENGKLFINVLQPVIVDGKTEAVLYSKIKLETIYLSLVATVKAGDKGYASIKNAEGILIMHPNTEDIGEEVIEARTSTYPDFDWSELENLVAKQRNGESGVGIYHSLWFNDNDQKRVKKFSAYSPAQIGSDFWIINISKDYLEVVSFLKERTYNIIIINFLIILIFVTTLLYMYRIKKDRALIENERALLVQVKQLNEELEMDIQMRRILESELIRSKNKFENIFESGSDCIMVIDLDDGGQLVEVNEKVTHSLGFTKEALLNMTYFDISDVMNPNELKNIQTELETSSSVIYEDVLIGNGELRIPVEINVKKMANESSKNLVMISRDITLKKRFEKEMEENKRKEALMIYQSRLAAMGEMIGSIAHQWRQPLSGISMIFNNLEDAYKFNELDDAFIKAQSIRLQELVKFMSQTIDDFRFFFNPKNDKQDFLISNVMDRTLDFLKESIRLNNIEIVYDLQEDILICGRPNQLSQVLFTIIKNAIDAILSCNTSERKIMIRITKEHQNIVLTIEDTGKGVLEANLDRIFDAYFTTKDAQNGTGLGLYISKVIVEKNFHGKIEAFNANKGLNIKIEFPIDQQEL